MFSKVTTLAAPAATKSKGKQKVTREIAGAEKLAMVSALSKALEAVKDTFAGMVKTEAACYFREQIDTTGRKPESFKATEGAAVVSVELRKRGSNHPLSEAQVAALRGAGFEPGQEVVTPKLFAINPAHAENTELLAKVEAALSGIVPENFIVLQPERVNYIVTDELLEAVMTKKAPAEVVSCVTSLACKPALKEMNMARIFEFVRELLAGHTPQPAANEGAPAAEQKAA
jgi:hypothetical protein